MKIQLLGIGAAFTILFISLAANGVLAQNLTTNASNTAGNMSASINQTSAEAGKNMSNAAGNASKSANATLSEAGKNISSSLNNTGESANNTLNEVGKNASQAGSAILNKTGEVGQKIVGGAANVLGNITSQIKKGLEGK
jgi:hypothetical protein